MQYKSYLDEYPELYAVRERIMQRRMLRWHGSSCSELRRVCLDMPSFEEALDYGVDKGGVFSVGQQQTLSDAQRQRVHVLLQRFIPWRTGPWRILGVDVLSGWRSGEKWERMKVAYPRSSSGLKVADIGCGNGYFMFRLLEHAPALVVGFEPIARHYYAYHLVQNYVRSSALHFEPLGFEDLDLYSKFFDVMVCMGVLYHQTDPVDVLRLSHRALAPGGKLLLATQGIPGADPVALMPRKFYNGKKGTWWLPTLSCLQNWILRAGFRDVEELYSEEIMAEDQRTTFWCPGGGWESELQNKAGTAAAHTTPEGYPQPMRFFVVARK